MWSLVIVNLDTTFITKRASCCNPQGIRLHFSEPVCLQAFVITTRIQDLYRYKNVCLTGDGKPISCSPVNFMPEMQIAIDFLTEFSVNKQHLVANEYELIWPACSDQHAQIADMQIQYTSTARLEKLVNKILQHICLLEYLIYRKLNYGQRQSDVEGRRKRGTRRLLILRTFD